MKSIEEKAKCYDEALKKLRTMRDAWNKLETDYSPKDVVKDIEYYFPELIESEDEKIRKALIKYFTLSDDNADYQCCGVHCKDIVAWLEKQKPDKNIVETWKEMRLEVYQQASGNRHESNCSDDTTKMFSLNDIDEIIEKMSEQKPADKVESDKKFTPIESALKDLICDVDNSYTIEQVRRFLFEYGYKDKILNAAQEEMQKPAEWSEEDEDIKDSIIHQLKMLRGDRNVTEGNKKEIDWLKSLRPQNRWKPSDLELDCLRLAVEKDGGTGLMGLYNKLCNLKGIGHGERQSKYMA